MESNYCFYKFMKAPTDSAKMEGYVQMSSPLLKWALERARQQREERITLECHVFFPAKQKSSDVTCQTQGGFPSTPEGATFRCGLKL